MRNGLPVALLLLIASSGPVLATEAADKLSPRVVIQENLSEIPDIKIRGADHGTDAPPGQPAGADAKPVEPRQNEGPATKHRAPLVYIQENIPFLSDRRITFFGRIEVDYADYSSGVLEDDSGARLRRLRLGLAGKVKYWPDWHYKIEADLSDEENTLSDTYMYWSSKKWGTVKLGNQKVAQTLSNSTSSISIPFMERPLPVLAFALNRRLAVGWDKYSDRGGVQATIFSIDPNEDIGRNGWSARAFINPMKSESRHIHFGASLVQLFDDKDIAQLRARPESHVTDIRLVDTGSHTDIKSGSVLGLELAAAAGSTTFRGEMFRAHWDRESRPNADFSGWYAEASWFLSGETPRYRDGKFVRPMIKSNAGAWEIAVRYSNLDLNDGDIVGGKEENYALGLNWYSRMHWRLMANVIKVRSEGPYGEQSPWIAQVRVQYHF